MKLTTKQLQKMIMEEIKTIHEKRVYDDQGNLLYPGGLFGQNNTKKNQFSGYATKIAKKYVAMLEEIKSEVDSEPGAKTPTFGPVAKLINGIRENVEQLILEIESSAKVAEQELISQSTKQQIKK